MNCAWCDEVSADLRDRSVGLLCQDCDLCEYCGDPADGCYTSHRHCQRQERVCSSCQEDLESGDRRWAAHERHMDGDI